VPITEAASFAKEKEFIHKTTEHEETGAPRLTSALLRIGHPWSKEQEL
jgi:hypothetical protein